MKKSVLHLLQVLLFMAVGLSAKAADYSVSIEWNTPGSVVITTTIKDLSKAVDLPEGSTSVTFDEKRPFYVYPAKGYTLESLKIVNADGSESDGRISNNGEGPFFTVSEYNNGKTFKFTTAKLESAGTITVDMPAGTSNIGSVILQNTDTKISTGTVVDVKAGQQTVDISTLDNQMQVASVSSSKKIFSVTVNGENQTSDKYGYYIFPIKAGDAVVINSQDPSQEVVDKTVTVKVAFANNNPQSLKSIRNRTAGKFYDDPSEFKAEEGDELQFNFNETYTLNSITANGTAVAFNPENGYARYTLTGNTDFVINASEKAKEYANVTVYIAGQAEALSFTTAFEGGDEISLVEKGAVSGPVVLGDTTVTANDVKEYTLTVEKKLSGSDFFYNVAPGYFLVEALNSVPKEHRVSNSGLQIEGAPYFFEVGKINNTATASVYYEGPANSAWLTSSNPSSEPAAYEGQQSSLAAGYTTIKFDPTYNVSFTARGVVAADGQLYVYNDNQKVAIDSEGNGLYTSALANGSALKVFNTTDAPTATTVNFTLAEGATAEVTYDLVRKYTDFTAPLKSVGPTEVTITPAEGFGIEVGGEAVQLTNGSYTFTAKGTKDVAIVVASQAPVAELPIESVTPAEGATVKSFSNLALSVSLLSTGYEVPMVDEEKAIAISVVTPDGQTIHPTEIDSSMSGMSVIVNFHFDEQTAAGTYKATVPEGLLYIPEYDNNGEPVPGAMVSASKAVEVSFTVNPSAAGPLDKYVVTPSNEQPVRSAAEIIIQFPSVQQVFPDYNAEITLSDGTTTYYGEAAPYYELGTMNAVAVNFLDENNDYEPVKFTEPGRWTFSAPAGSFKTNSELSPAIELTYIIDPEAPLTWTADPANGSKNPIDEETAYGVYVTFTINGAEMVSYEPFDELAGIRVSYNGAEISPVEDVDEETGWMLNEWKEDNAAQILLSGSVFSAPGTLKISIDEGRFTVNDSEASPSIEWEASFGDVKSYQAVFTPASGSTVEDLKNITVAFPDAETAEFNAEAAYIILNGPSTIYPTDPVVTPVEGASCPTFNINFPLWGDGFISRPGSYNIVIGSGTFTLDGDQRNEELTAYWTVKNDNVDLSWKPSPSTDVANEGYGVYVSFVFDELVSVGYNWEGMDKIKVTFNGENIPYAMWAPEDGSAYFSAQGDSYTPNLFMINAMGGIFNDASAAGEFKVEIPEGVLTANGTPVPAISYTWNVIGKKEYTLNVTPAPDSTVASLKEFTVEFQGAKTIALNDEYGYQVSLRSNDYTSYPSTRPASIVVVEGTEWATIKITFEKEATAAGKYTLNLSYGAFKLDNAFDTANYDFVYTVDGTQGIGDIVADENGLYTVVNLAGVVVLKDAEADAVRNLPAGFYIVNGQKVFVK